MKLAFEDFEPGRSFPLGPIPVTAEEIIEFATEFDPSAEFDPAAGCGPQLGQFFGLVISPHCPDGELRILMERPVIGEFYRVRDVIGEPLFDSRRPDGSPEHLPNPF